MIGMPVADKDGREVFQVHTLIRSATGDPKGTIHHYVLPVHNEQVRGRH